MDDPVRRAKNIDGQTSLDKCLKNKQFLLRVRLKIELIELKEIPTCVQFCGAQPLGKPEDGCL